MFLQILIVSCLAVFANAQIDVSGCTGYSAAVTKCNTDYSIANGKDFTWADVAGFWALDPTVYCTAANKENFMKRAKCVQEAYIACGKNNFGMLVPSANGIAEAVQYFCNNYADFDIGCTSGIGGCIQQKADAMNLTMPAMSEGYDMAKMYYCGQAKYMEECMMSDTKLRDCAKTKSKDIYREIVEELVPPACDSTSVVISSVLLLVSLFITL